MDASAECLASPASNVGCIVKCTCSSPLRAAKLSLGSLGTMTFFTTLGAFLEPPSTGESGVHAADVWISYPIASFIMQIL